jgi:hypothetical protein
MAALVGERVSCSLQAAGAAWLVSGVVFTVVTKGPGTVAAWVIWGSPFFVAGWFLVGLPIVALGDRTLRMNAALLMAAAGVGGALVMELPAAVVRALSPQVHWAWSLQDLKWPGFAFAIAASAAWFYRVLLKSRSGGASDGPDTRNG